MSDGGGGAGMEEGWRRMRKKSGGDGGGGGMEEVEGWRGQRRHGEDRGRMEVEEVGEVEEGWRRVGRGGMEEDEEGLRGGVSPGRSACAVARRRGEEPSGC